MSLYFSAPSFLSHLTNVVCLVESLIWLMLYLFPQRALPFFFFFSFGLYSFSIFCLFFPLQSGSLSIWVSNFLFHLPTYIFCFLSGSYSRSRLSFISLCLSFPKPSPTCSHFLFFFPHISTFPLPLLPWSSSSPLPSPTCYLQTSHPVLCFVQYAILQQVSVLSPFSPLPTSCQTSPAPAVWLKLCSIWTKTSNQGLGNGHSP